MANRNDNLDDLAAHFSELAARYGDSPLTGQWRDLETQENRLRVLCDFVDQPSAKVLDLGCGTAQLFHVLTSQRGFKGEYVGYDLSDKVLETARRRFPMIRFELRNILSEGIPEDFDYVLMSGIFNNPVGDNWQLMTDILKRVYPRVRRVMAFNALSRYVDYVEPDLYYVDPGEIFRFCKENLSPQVVLRHEYCVKPGVVPFEFTIGVFASQLPSRKLAEPVSVDPR
jgi:SAM-dependent methyltransferase